MKTKKDNIQTLSQFRDKHHGKPGKKKDEIESGYENCKLAR